MATTDRGIYYTDGGNDGDVADLNVITKAIADSTEAAMDALDGQKLSKSGGTMTGDLRITATTGDKGVSFEEVSVRRFYIGLEASSDELRVHSYNSSGVWQGVALSVTAGGHVSSKSHISGTHSGTPNMAGYLNMPIATSPGPNGWRVVANAERADNGAPLTVVGVPLSATQVTFTVYAGTTPYQGAVNIFWQAVAY